MSLFKQLMAEYFSRITDRTPYLRSRKFNKCQAGCIEIKWTTVMKFKNTKDKKEDIKSRKITYKGLIAIRLLCNVDFSTATVTFTRPQNNISNVLRKK